MTPARMLTPCWCLLLIAAAPAVAPPDARTLLTCERSLDHDSAVLGARGAFLKWLARGAIMFHPQPGDARAIYEALGPAPSRFIREPRVAVMSRSDDLGWVSGAWMLKQDSTQTRIDYYGEYVTLWHKQPDGGWKVVFDGGLPHAPPVADTGEPIPITMPAPSHATSSAARHTALDLAEGDFGATALENSVYAAVERFGADSLLLLRAGQAPVVGMLAARDSLASWDSSARLDTDAQFTSDAGDIGYGYGSFVTQTGAAPDTGYFLHVWQRGRTRPWELVVDFLQPASH